MSDVEHGKTRNKLQCLTKVFEISCLTHNSTSLLFTYVKFIIPYCIAFQFSRKTLQRERFEDEDDGALCRLRLSEQLKSYDENNFHVKKIFGTIFPFPDSLETSLVRETFLMRTVGLKLHQKVHP